jgi:solute carrier family 35 protein C2
MNGSAQHDAAFDVELRDVDTNVHLASLSDKKRLWWRTAAINGAYIASWCVVLSFDEASALPATCRFLFALVLQLYNKWMFAPDRFGFPYPLFVTMLHMFVQWILAASLRHLWPKHFRSEHTPSKEGYM